jgi:hypothetical protein
LRDYQAEPEFDRTVESKRSTGKYVCTNAGCQAAVNRIGACDKHRPTKPVTHSGKVECALCSKGTMVSRVTYLDHLNHSHGREGKQFAKVLVASIPKAISQCHTTLAGSDFPDKVDAFITPRSEALHSAMNAFTTDAITHTYQVRVPVMSDRSGLDGKGDLKVSQVPHYAHGNAFPIAGAMVTNKHVVIDAIGPPLFRNPLNPTGLTMPKCSDHPSGAIFLDDWDLAVWRLPQGVTSLPTDNVVEGKDYLAIRLTHGPSPRFQLSAGPCVQVGTSMSTTDHRDRVFSNANSVHMLVATEAGNSGCPYIASNGKVVAIHAGGCGSLSKPGLAIPLTTSVMQAIAAAMQRKNVKGGGSAPVLDTGLPPST